MVSTIFNKLQKLWFLLLTSLPKKSKPQSKIGPSRSRMHASFLEIQNRLQCLRSNSWNGELRSNRRRYISISSIAFIDLLKQNMLQNWPRVSYLGMNPRRCLPFDGRKPVHLLPSCLNAVPMHIFMFGIRRFNFLDFIDFGAIFLGQR